MIVLLGKNGSGKTYLAKAMKEKGYNYSPCYTTRPMRPKEVNGIDYVFVSEEEFLKKIKDGFFIEHKEFNCSYYGTPITKLSDDAITVGGNVNLLSMGGKNPVQIVYIHADIDKRFERMDKRDKSNISLFNRIHGENFEYLYDFQGHFVDNTDENGINVLTGLINVDGSIVNRPTTSNYDFLDTLQYTFSPKDDQLLQFLKFEERFLISIKTLAPTLSEGDIKDFYMRTLINYSKEIGIGFTPKSADDFYMTCDRGTFEGQCLAHKLKSVR